MNKKDQNEISNLKKELDKCKNSIVENKRKITKNTRRINLFGGKKWALAFGTGIIGAIIGSVISLSPQILDSIKEQKFNGHILAYGTQPNYNLIFEKNIYGELDSVSALTYMLKIDIVSNKDVLIRKSNISMTLKDENIIGQQYYIEKGFEFNYTYDDILQRTYSFEKNKLYQKHINFYVSLEKLKMKTKHPKLYDKLKNRLEFNKEEWKTLRNNYVPENINVEFQRMNNTKTNFNLSMKNDLDFYSIELLKKKNPAANK